MTPLYWTPLLAAVWNLLVAAFVISCNTKQTANKVFFLLGCAIAVWNFGTFQMFLVKTPDAAIFWGRFLHFGVLFIPVCLVHLSILIADLKAKWVPPALYAFTILMSATNFTDFYISDVTRTEYAYYTQAGPGFWIFSPILFSSITASIFVLLLKHRSTTASILQRRKLDFLIFGQSIFVFFGINDVLPILGIFTYPFTDIPVYPWGTLAAVLYGTVIAYSLLQHQLLDVHINLGRFSAQIIRILFLLICLLLLFAIASFVFPDHITQEAAAISISLLLLSIVIVSILFPRLLGASSEKLERTILGDNFEYHDKIRTFNKSIQYYTDGEQLLEDIQFLLIATVKVSRFAILIRDERSKRFVITKHYPDNIRPEDLTINESSPLIAALLETGKGYLAVGENYQPGFSGVLAGKPLAQTIQLRGIQAEFCFPLQSATNLFGFLILDKKSDNTPYTPQDITLLSETCRNASLVINQIRLKRQIEAQEELELVGVMSKGLAHDLNNLFTPINTYFQLIDANLEEGDEDTSTGHNQLFGIVRKNIDAIQNYLKESLFFSNKLTPHCQAIDLSVVLDESVRLCQHRIGQKAIDIQRDFERPLHIFVDSVLLQRLFSNLIINAIDASPKGSIIRLEAERFSRTDTNGVWYRITVTDYGQGIPKHLQKRVFTPYFTTKDSGENERGAGLGLAICRKIAHLHEGTITLTSAPGKGSVVEVNLPSRMTELENTSHSVEQEARQ